MYEEQFGLTGRPFGLTPDPRFWFETGTHRKAMTYLGYGLSQGEGFIVVTGDIGTGKTTLVGHLMEQIDPARLNAIRIVSSAIEADDLLRIVAGGLGVDAAGLSKAALLVAIERGLHSVARNGRRTLLIVDEAQALPVSALEELRMLSNFQAGGHAILQIFLLGQPEFRERLHGSDRLEQLRQRVIASHHLDPMEPDEVEPYVAHRLAMVGWRGRPDFADDAFPALYRGSAGVPRRLNQLAERMMLHAAVEDLTVIDGDTVDQVAADIAGDLGTMDKPMTAAPSSAPPRPIRAVETSADVGAPIGAPVPLSAVVARLRQVHPVKTPVGSATAAEPVAEAGLPAEPAVASADAAELEARIQALEERVEAQDAALRRVLTLLVDWAEGDGHGAMPAVHDAAA